MAEHVTVDFEIETETGYDIKPVKIKKMRFAAFHEVMAIVNDIYGLIEKDPALQIVFQELFDPPEAADYEALKNFNEEELAEMKKQHSAEAEKRFVQGLLGAFPLLTVHLPTQATALLIALTGVDSKLLQEQDLFVVMNVYDACLEVNKVEELVERIKKSFDATKRAMNWITAKRKATQ